MVAINFKPQFAEKISSGKKTQTIRSVRKNAIKTGDKLVFFTGLRTKNCQKIGSGIVKTTHELTILADGDVIIDNCEIFGDDLHQLACDDGFETDRPFQQFITFFRDHYGLPFTGTLIKWDLAI